MERLILAAREGKKLVDPPARVLAQDTKPRGEPEVPVSVRLDPDLVAALRLTGKGWQSRVNIMLRDAMHLPKGL